MVVGKVLARDGEVLIADEAAVRADAQMQAREVARHVAALSRPAQDGADPVHREMALLEAMTQGQLWHPIWNLAGPFYLNDAILSQRTWTECAFGSSSSDPLACRLSGRLTRAWLRCETGTPHTSTLWPLPRRDFGRIRACRIVV